MLGVLAAGGSAVATAAPAPDRPAVVGHGQHCVANLDSGVVGCADRPGDAVRLAGSVDALTIARFYDGTGYSGATFTWTQSRQCTPSYDAEWQWDNLADIGWNNRVSSVHTYNQCDVRLFDGTNFSGAASTWIDASSNLGAIGDGWNNRASSVKFS
ncbi:MAG TPA: hypothetical protein VGD67_24350 [Pseudonocardiaceae bacterium]